MYEAGFEENSMKIYQKFTGRLYSKSNISVIMILLGTQTWTVMFDRFLFYRMIVR
jgi:hypothetical protein